MTSQDSSDLFAGSSFQIKRKILFRLLFFSLTATISDVLASYRAFFFVLSFRKIQDPCHVLKGLQYSWGDRMVHEYIKISMALETKGLVQGCVCLEVGDALLQGHLGDGHGGGMS